jgi:class 3 adenylate cyclase/tetratricopeptide (TPR) repeat protein
MEGPAGVCPNCGSRNDAAARFCSTCGSRLAPAIQTDPAASQTPVPASRLEPERPPRELERKVITALFCDVVGSTDMAERLDPEDVEQLMSTYHGRARRVIEAHGGVVEKFIGDAVVGVFGAPSVHEDDPSRAVRASLAILRDLAAAGFDLHVRIGVHTGEAVVRVDADRAPEESLATGGSLNTAARIQGAAPPDGVAVGDTTYRLAAAEFRWDDLGAVALKGIAEPVHIWRPIEARSAAARGQDTEATPFLGRDTELAALERAFESAVATSQQQLVTIVAEPGLGKSRLIRELRRRVESAVKGTVWRTGRCLPYGDGISFWALGEIVKSHAGILETDDQATIGRKLDGALKEPDPALRAWMRERLAPLAGLRTDAVPPSQEEAFAAWRRFLESLAAPGPAVIVIEDLHWADPALVSFLLDLAEHPAALPILLVVATRPEIADRHPQWLAAAPAARVLQLVSLDDEAIAGLIGSTLGDASPELLRTVLERAAGSPLYAEQLAALIRDRGLSATEATLEESAIPPTVQALLAARIDALPRELKPALLDASVIGRVFWSGAVATLEGRDRSSVEPSLSDLERRALTRSNHPSAMVDELEYGFWHALLRDVAYSFLPRAARLAKHRAAAAWIFERAGDSSGDVAEIVADHLRRALELAGATGATEVLPAIESDLVATLIIAADHARSIEPERTIRHLREALDRLGADHARRGGVLAALGHALLARGEVREAAISFEAAQARHLDAGDELAAARLAAPRAIALQNGGDIETARAVIATARPMLSEDPASLLDLEAVALGVLGETHEQDASLRAANEVVALAGRLGLPPPTRVLMQRGLALLESGDASGEAGVRMAIEMAVAAGDLRQAIRGFGLLGSSIMDVGRPTPALAIYDEGLAFAAAHGMRDDSLRGSRLDALELAGRWDDVLAEAPLLRTEALARGDAWTAFMAGMQSAGVLVQRGATDVDSHDLILEGRSVGLPPSIGAGISAFAALKRGDARAARSILEDALELTPEGRSIYGLVESVWAALKLGDQALARRLLTRAFPEDDSSRGQLTRLATAMVAAAEGDHVAALERFEASHAYFATREWATSRAQALAGAGRSRLALGDTAAGLDLLRRARAEAEALQYELLLSEIDPAIASVPAEHP